MVYILQRSVCHVHLDRGHIDQVKARVSPRLFLKSIYPKDFRNSLKLTYFDPSPPKFALKATQKNIGLCQVQLLRKSRKTSKNANFPKNCPLWDILVIFLDFLSKCNCLKTRWSRGCSTYSLVINWLSKWVSEPIPPNLPDIINPKPLELGSWNFERMFTPPPCVTCHMSGVTRHMSGVRCHVSSVTCHFLWKKVVKLAGGGSVINGAYPV